MTTRAADDFGAIHKRMQELKGQKSPSPPPPPKYQGATPITPGTLHICDMHNYWGKCGICQKTIPGPPTTFDDYEEEYFGGFWREGL